MLNEVTLVVDIDGILCPIRGKNEKYEDLCPCPQIVEKLREYKNDGARIVLFSARGMNTYQGNLGKINAYTAPTLIMWLKKWEVPFDEIYFGKPWPNKNGFYIDDRTVRPAEFMKYSLFELEKLCQRDRL